MAWNKNKTLLFGIVGDLIRDMELQHVSTSIHQALTQIIDKYHKKQYEFKNITEVNKSILTEIHDYIGKVKQATFVSNQQQISQIPHNPQIPQIPHNSMGQPQFNHNPSYIKDEYTRETIQATRESLLNKQLQSKQDDFNQYMKTKPQDIDFTDKTQETDASIDDLLAIEMNKRKAELELYQTSDKTAKEVEDWIHNSTPQLLNTTTNTTSNENSDDVSKITITNQDVNLKSSLITSDREKQKIDKKVSFQNLHTNELINEYINSDIKSDTNIVSVSPETNATTFTSKLKSILKPKQSPQQTHQTQQTQSSVVESTTNVSQENTTLEISNLTTKVTELENKLNTVVDKLDVIYSYILSNKQPTELPDQ